MGRRCWPPHVFPLPPGNPRSTPVTPCAAASPRARSALALRAIRHPDACGRLTPPVVLLWISRVLLLPVFLLRVSCTRGDLRSLYLILVSLVLLLGIWRPSIRIPAVAENGNIPARPASRRSLSGTHFAGGRQCCAGGKGRGRCALCSAEGLRASFGSLAPLAQRAIKVYAECEPAPAASHPMSPAPEGRIIRQTVCLAAPALPAPRNIT